MVTQTGNSLLKTRLSWRHFWQSLTLVVYVGVCMNASAHEVRPAYLELRETATDVYQVIWKQPVQADRRLPIDPVLPETCDTTQSDIPENTGSALIQRWQVSCDLHSGFVNISGLTRTLTDVMVRVSYLDGGVRTELLRPDKPTLDLGDPNPPVGSYLLFGIEHLLFGIDHILFVIGLVLFIRDRLMLLKTITAFTIAHSITLGLSVLDLFTIPQRPVEAVIALSILFLARELVVPKDRRSALTQLRPWLMAFVFGLLHGFGFAGALVDIGLPREQIAVSLLLFNVGIEIGQLIVIGVMLSALWLLTKAKRLSSTAWEQAFTYAMGGMAVFWTLDRVLLVF